MVLESQRVNPTKTHTQKARARGDWIRLTSLRRELLNSVLCEGIAEGKRISEENSWMSSSWRIGVSLDKLFCRSEYRKLGEDFDLELEFTTGDECGARGAQLDSSLMEQYAGSDDLELVNWEERLQALMQIWPWINYAVVWKLTPDKRYLFKLFNSTLTLLLSSKKHSSFETRGGNRAAPQAPESGVHSTFNRPNLVYKEIQRHFGFWFCTDKFPFSWGS